MLCGHYPEHVKANSKEIDFQYSQVYLPDEALDLLKKMLEPNPKMRIQYNDIMAHPLMQKYHRLSQRSYDDPYKFDM